MVRFTRDTGRPSDASAVRATCCCTACANSMTDGLRITASESLSAGTGNGMRALITTPSAEATALTRTSRDPLCTAVATT